MTKVYLAIPGILQILVLNFSIFLKHTCSGTVATPTSTAAYQAAPTWIKWREEIGGKGTDGVWHRENRISLAYLWSAHLEMDTLPFLVQEVMALISQLSFFNSHLPPLALQVRRFCTARSCSGCEAGGRCCPSSSPGSPERAVTSCRRAVTNCWRHWRMPAQNGDFLKIRM